jgi:hypothetical protein
VRANDLIPLGLMLDGVVADAADLLRANKQEEFEMLLDRLACLAALFIRIGRRDLFNQVVDTLRGIYNLSFDQNGFDRNVGERQPVKLRLSVVLRVMALGALAARREDWSSLRTLVVQRGSGRDFGDGRDTNWIRHAQVGASRAGLLSWQDEEGRWVERGLLSLVLATVARIECLHRDVAGEGVGEDERLIDSVVQFDALAFLVVAAFAPGRDVPYYPSFATYRWHRFERLLVKLVEDGAMRQEIYPKPLPELAKEMAEMFALAAREAKGYGVAGLDDERLQAFLRQHGFAAEQY